jgi:hypothetical protein
MGAFYVNFHAKTPSCDAIQSALADLAEQAWVAPVENGWVSVYEADSSSQSEETICRLAESLSREVRCPVIAFCVHDSDVLLYWLFDGGDEKDRFNSCPDYFGDLEEMSDDPDEAESYRNATVGRADVLAGYCSPPVAVEAVEQLLQQEDFSLMAEDRLQHLARLLGIDPSRCLMDYNSIGREIGADELALQWIGAGPLPEDSEHLEDFERRRAEAERLIASDIQLQLHHAVASGSIDEVERLLNAGADVNGTPSVSPATALIVSATRSPSDPNLVRFLLARGASVNQRGAFGKTALSFAMIQPDPEVVQILLEAGAEPNFVDEQGETPLLLATRACEPHVVELLTSAGANPHLRSDSGDSPLDWVGQMIPLQEEALAKTDASDSRATTVVEEMLGRFREIRRILEDAGGD